MMMSTMSSMLQKDEHSRCCTASSIRALIHPRLFTLSEFLSFLPPCGPFTDAYSTSTFSEWKLYTSAVCTHPSRTQQGYIPCRFSKHFNIWGIILGLVKCSNGTEKHQKRVNVTADKTEKSFLKHLLRQFLCYSDWSTIMRKPDDFKSLVQVKVWSTHQPGTHLGFGAAKTRTQIERALFCRHKPSIQ